MAKRVAPLRPARRNEFVDGRHVSIRVLELKEDVTVISNFWTNLIKPRGPIRTVHLLLSLHARLSLSPVLSLSPTVHSLSSILSLAGTAEVGTGPKRTVSSVRSRPTAFRGRKRRILPAVATGLKPILSGVAPPFPATISVESGMVSNLLHLLKLSVR